MKDDYIFAHKYNANHKNMIKNDQVCGCFYCLQIFHLNEIFEWIEDEKGTAICPYCGIDSIIGESSGYPITKNFLLKMQRYWF